MDSAWDRDPGGGDETFVRRLFCRFEPCHELFDQDVSHLRCDKCWVGLFNCQRKPFKNRKLFSVNLVKFYNILNAVLCS